MGAKQPRCFKILCEILACLHILNQHPALFSAISAVRAMKTTGIKKFIICRKIFPLQYRCAASIPFTPLSELFWSFIGSYLLVIVVVKDEHIPVHQTFCRVIMPYHERRNFIQFIVFKFKVKPVVRELCQILFS